MVTYLKKNFSWYLIQQKLTFPYQIDLNYSGKYCLNKNLENYFNCQNKNIVYFVPIKLDEKNYLQYLSLILSMNIKNIQEIELDLMNPDKNNTISIEDEIIRNLLNLCSFPILLSKNFKNILSSYFFKENDFMIKEENIINDIIIKENFKNFNNYDFKEFFSYEELNNDKIIKEINNKDKFDFFSIFLSEKLFALIDILNYVFDLYENYYINIIYSDNQTNKDISINKNSSIPIKLNEYFLKQLKKYLPKKRFQKISIINYKEINNHFSKKINNNSNVYLVNIIYNIFAFEENPGKFFRIISNIIRNSNTITFHLFTQNTIEQNLTEFFYQNISDIFIKGMNNNILDYIKNKNNFTIRNFDNLVIRNYKNYYNKENLDILSIQQFLKKFDIFSNYDLKIFDSVSILSDTKLLYFINSEFTNKKNEIKINNCFDFIKKLNDEIYLKINNYLNKNFESESINRKLYNNNDNIIRLTYSYDNNYILDNKNKMKKKLISKRNISEYNDIIEIEIEQNINLLENNLILEEKSFLENKNNSILNSIERCFKNPVIFNENKHTSKNNFDTNNLNKISSKNLEKTDINNIHEGFLGIKRNKIINDESTKNSIFDEERAFSNNSDHVLENSLNKKKTNLNNFDSYDSNGSNNTCEFMVYGGSIIQDDENNNINLISVENYSNSLNNIKKNIELEDNNQMEIFNTNDFKIVSKQIFSDNFNSMNELAIIDNDKITINSIFSSKMEILDISSLCNFMKNNLKLDSIKKIYDFIFPLNENQNNLKNKNSNLNDFREKISLFNIFLCDLVFTNQIRNLIIEKIKEFKLSADDNIKKFLYIIIKLNSEILKNITFDNLYFYVNLLIISLNQKKEQRFQFILNCIYFPDLTLIEIHKKVFEMKILFINGILMETLKNNFEKNRDFIYYVYIDYFRVCLKVEFEDNYSSYFQNFCDKIFYWNYIMHPNSPLFSLKKSRESLETYFT